ncbi:protein AAR2 homolog [Elysia marginata]|uniref:Protein AAR2 homolog n=1 Tax=Elysia marginata TaxID=1093978 RepID=A0AAV4IFS6_9GAST|nr:protein AAR2 homolog [Elysia marginata]
MMMMMMMMMTMMHYANPKSIESSNLTAPTVHAKENREMDQSNAQKLFEQGAMFVLHDFPEKSEFGIDYMSWDTGPNFKGLKMIPAGIHFIYFSSVSSEGQRGPRSGFFYNFTPQEVVVRHWDAQAEDIKPTRLSDGEMERYVSNKQDLDKFLGPYPYDKYKQWISLSKHISPELVDLLQPDCKTIYSVPQFESAASTTQSRRAAAQARATQTSKDNQTSHTSQDDETKISQSLPELVSVESSKIKYSEIPKKKYPPGATPSEISKYNMDSSYALDVLLERFNKDFDKLLGEIQFAFLCFLIGQDFDSFEQWKKLVHLVCTSGEALKLYSEAYLSFISVLHFQIKEVPSDFFVDIVTSDNFLTSTLYELFQNIASQNVDKKLQKKSKDFEKHLTEKFKWDFSAEPDEYAPVVVE